MDQEKQYKIHSHALEKERQNCLWCLVAFLFLLCFYASYDDVNLVVFLMPSILMTWLFFFLIIFWKAETLVYKLKEIELKQPEPKPESKQPEKKIKAQYYSKEYLWFFDLLLFEKNLRSWFIWPIVASSYLYFYLWTFRQAFVRIISFNGELGLLAMILLWFSALGLIILFVAHVIACRRVYAEHE